MMKHWLSVGVLCAWSFGCVTASNDLSNADVALSDTKTKVNNTASTEANVESLPDINSSQSVFQVRGNVARQVYQQLASVGQRSHDGGQEVVKFMGDLEISCTRSGGVLPAGTRGFPPPVDYECQIKGAAIGKDGKPSSSREVVTLKNGSAKRFFGALATTPIQSQDKVSKSLKGEMVITCKGAVIAKEGARCEAERVAH